MVIPQKISHVFTSMCTDCETTNVNSLFRLFLSCTVILLLLTFGAMYKSALQQANYEFLQNSRFTILFDYIRAYPNGQNEFSLTTKNISTREKKTNKKHLS